MSRLPQIAGMTPEWRAEISQRLNIARVYSSAVLVHGSKLPLKNFEIGTAVMLRVDGETFAITAKHCVTDDMEIVCNKEQGSFDRPLDILGSVEHQTLDLALVKVRDTRFNAISIDQIAIPNPAVLTSRSAQNDGTVIWAAGYPACEIDVVGPNSLDIGLYATGVEFVNVTDERITVHFAEEGIRMGHDGSYPRQGPYPQRPNGMSGGGVWAQMAHTGGLFTPERHVKLFGISESWLPSTREFYSVNSLQILRLLFETHPDIANNHRHLLPQ
jgi:hypothetical protein